MNNITSTEMNVLLAIVKSPELAYNANSLAAALEITAMGALKIVKRLEQESVLTPRKIGNATIYRIAVENTYARRYAAFVLACEAHHTNPAVKRWIIELRKIKNADLVVLFGSVLTKENYRDIDVLLVTDQKRFLRLKKEIKELSGLTAKKIHPLYQTFDDLVENIKKRHKPILNAIKGIVICGEEKFLEVYNESRKE